MKKLLFAALTAGLLSTPALAQPPARKPGEEEKRIGFFAGTWTFEGEVKASPMGPAGKSSGRDTCEWFPGAFHLVCRGEGTSPMGTSKSQSIFGYDPNEKTYTFYLNSSLGDGFFGRGNVSGKVWTWNFENKMEGKLMKGRVTITEESPTAYSFKTESSVDGGPWTLIEEAKARKVK
jgi:Protein of unknown function (DUF1579)